MNRRSVRAILFAVVLSALFGIGAYAVTFSEIACEDLAGGGGANPKFIAKPYIVGMGTDSVRIMWQTDAPALARIVVRNSTSAGEFRTRKATRLACVKMSSLRPDTHYTYTVWINTPSGIRKATASGSFRTYPEKSRLVNFVVYGDSRSSPERHGKVLTAMAHEKDIDFILHSGDLVRDGSKFEQWPTDYFNPIENLASNVPFYTVRGNHDGRSYYYQLLGLSDNPKWRSFDVLGIHMICLDSMESFDVGSDQYKWLVSNLTKHKAAKWKFIMIHSPVYSSGPHGAVDSAGVPKETAVRVGRKLFPELARKFGIQAIFSGHDHFYERSEYDGVQYVISGGGGAGTYTASNPKANPYKKVFYSGLHYCVINVNGDKARMVVKTPEGEVLDRVSL